PRLPTTSEPATIATPPAANTRPERAGPATSVARATLATLKNEVHRLTAIDIASITSSGRPVVDSHAHIVRQLPSSATGSTLEAAAAAASSKRTSDVVVTATRNDTTSINR